MMFFVLYYSFAMRPLRLSFIRVRLRTLPPLSLSHPRREQIIFHRLSLSAPLVRSAFEKQRGKTPTSSLLLLLSSFFHI